MTDESARRLSACLYDTVYKLEEASYRMIEAARMNAEIEAMKAENQQREMEGDAPAWGFDAFMETRNKYQG